MNPALYLSLSYLAGGMIFRWWGVSSLLAGGPFSGFAAKPLNAARQVGQGDAANLLKRGPRLGGVVGGGPAQVWVVFGGQSAVMHQAAAVAAPSLVPSVVFSGQGEAFV